MSHNLSCGSIYAEHFCCIIIHRAICQPFLEVKCINLAFSMTTCSTVSISSAENKGVCEDLRTGQLFLVGQSWQLDDCTTCFCGKNGRAACAVKMCDRFPKCQNPVKTKGQCCPMCKDSEGGSECFGFSHMIQATRTVSYLHS